MSRFDYYEPDYNNQYKLWDHNVRLAISGRRGQKALRELRTALEALPEKRLIEGELVTKTGEVCAVGAYVVHKRASRGEAREKVLEDLYRLDHYDDGTPNGDQSVTTDEGKDAGLTFVLAWHLGYLNDEEFRGQSPEQRYASFVAWIDRMLVSPVPA